MLLSGIRRWLRVGVASTVTLAIAGVGLFSVPATSDAVMVPAIAVARSLSLMIGIRSPGGRAEGALAKARINAAKDRQVAALVPDTSSRRRLAPRETAPPTLDEYTFSPNGPPDVGPFPQFASGQVPDFAPSGNGIAFPPSFGAIGGGSGSSGGGSIGGSTGGGGGTTSSGGSTGGVVSPPVLSAIPEPDMWLMMIVGFGATGAMLRRRRPRVADRVA